MSFETRPAHFRRRGTTIDDILSSDQSSPDITRRRTYATNQRSLSMSPMKTPRESSMRTNQTLKPIIQRRQTMLNSSIAQLIRLSGVPRLHADDDAYISDTFKNENTSKFVIGTLWNTFALVNNLFLQRPRNRRNAMTGESIQAEQLARLQQIYSIAERNQNDQQTSTDNLRTIVEEIISPRKTENLQTIVSDLRSPTQKPLCSCYGAHHVPTCQFYDHSLPYIKKFIDRTVQLEDKYLNRLVSRDATTQSDPDKPLRILSHLKSLHHVSTQSSPIQQFKQTYSNVSTQCSPIENQRKYSQDFHQPSKYINHHYVNMSTQTNTKKTANDSSTQFSPMNLKEHIYVNTTVQLSPTDSDQQRISLKKAPEENIYDRRNMFFKEIRPIVQPARDQQSNPKVKNLVSLFETALPLKKPTYIVPMIVPKVDRNLQQYANGVASKIVKNAVSTASTNIIQTNEQLQKRFSLYKNGGGHGKNLLFQTNTFLPSPEQTKQNLEPNIRVESQASSIFLNDHNPLSEVQQTLIVGHHVDGTESKRKKRAHSTTEPHFTIDYSSSNEDDEDDEEDVDDENPNEQVDRQQFLSNSQLFSAQELYIRPWLIRRATAPDIHCLDTEIIDTRVEHLPSAAFETYFHVFPSHQYHVDVCTRLTCLVAILFYLDYVHDRYSNRILYDEIEQIEREFFMPPSTPSTSPSPVIHSNTFQTVNPDGSKRYRTGFVLDVKSPGNHGSQRQILAREIQWKRVKIIVRRFRKKYLYYKQFMKNDQQKSPNQRNINELFKYFDSTSKRRIKKYAKHYAQKL